jgi:hypothetical protein
LGQGGLHYCSGVVVEVTPTLAAEVADAPAHAGLPLRRDVYPGAPARPRARPRRIAARRWELTATHVAAGVAFTLMVAASLMLVSLAAARPSWLSPIGERGPFPHWLAGPLGPLTSWFTLNTHGLNVAFTAIVATMCVAYAVAVFAAPRVRARWALAAIVLVHLVFVLSPPMQLTDIFNYMNYARMEVVHGLNPYTTIPALEPASDPTYLLSNWHGLLSPYGPLFTLFTLAMVPLGVAGAFWAFKIVLMALSLGIILMVWRCAELLGRNPLSAAVFVGLNPLVLVWGLGGDHNDFFMVFLIVLGLYLLLRAESARIGLRAPGAPGIGGERPAGALVLVRRAYAWLDGAPRPLPIGEPGPWLELGAGVALSAAVAIKASAAILVPVMIFGAPRRARFAIGVALGLLVFGAATVVAFGFNLPDLAQQDSLVVQAGIPNLIGYVAGAGGDTAGLHHVFTGVLIAGVIGATLWAARTRRWITASGSAVLVLLMTLSWMLPSYILWLLPFAALARARWLRLTSLVFGVYVFLFWMPYGGALEHFLHLHLGATALAHQIAALQHSLEY